MDNVTEDPRPRGVKANTYWCEECKEWHPVEDAAFRRISDGEEVTALSDVGNDDVQGVIQRRLDEDGTDMCWVFVGGYKCVHDSFHSTTIQTGDAGFRRKESEDTCWETVERNSEVRVDSFWAFLVGRRLAAQVSS